MTRHLISNDACLTFRVDRKLIDRSFTNLGYIGFGDGIDFSALDNTRNW
jgi:hypothetical protein